jgi:ABC-type multidrug transport system fused ATPase/permease subunit
MLTPVLILMTEGLVLVGVSAVLLALEPVGALIVVATLGVLGLIVHFSTKGVVLRWGNARQLHEGLRIQHLQQGLGSVKDVVLLGREHDFLQQYRVHNAGSASVNRKLQTLHQMPRPTLELLAVLSLAILVGVMLRRGISVESILPTIGLFAAAAFRIMPSVNRVINSLHSMRYGQPVVATLYDELHLPLAREATATQPTPFERDVKLANVTYRYPGSNVAALKQVDLTIRHGTTVGFIGGSGAGKSTLVDVLLGLLPPDSGSVEVDGVDIAPNRRGWQRNIGYVPQSIFLTDDSLRRNIAFGIAEERIDDRAVARAVRAAQLEEYIATLPEGLATMVGERGVRLSGGQLQRVGIARALYHDPDVLVLDEATSSLDAPTERGVMHSVGALHGRKTIVIVAHRLSTLADCDWVYRLEGGELVAQGDVEKMIGSAVSRAS